MIDKVSRWMLAVIAIGVAVIIYLLWRNKKDTEDQSSLMRAMAERLNSGSGSGSSSGSSSSSSSSSGSEYEGETEEETKQITQIADKIYYQEQLTQEEKKFYEKFTAQIQEEVLFSQVFYQIVDKTVKGDKLTDDEKEFYENNKENIKKVVLEELSKIEKETDKETKEEKPDPFFIKKENTSADDFEQPLTPHTQPSGENLNKANPPISADERLKIMLSLFEDGIPKTAKIIKELYYKARGVKPNNDIYSVLKKIESMGAIKSCMVNGLAHFAPIEWLDGKKLKPEYKEKIK